MDITGNTYGRLKVLALSHKNAQGRLFWKCRCACGYLRVVSGSRLRVDGVGACKKCATKGVNTTHGGSNTRTYASWTAMRHRCITPERRDYHFYGGRGIKICERWQDFECFLADMGKRPLGKTLERIDSDGNYEPNNCCWATAKEQARNRRNGVFVTFEGVTQTVAAWAEQLGVSYSTLGWRKQQGWSDAEIICGRS